MTASTTPANCDAIFVMGLPRSGSTLLSRVLNNSPDILSINDLYFLQGVKARGVIDSHLSMAQAAELTDLLLEVVDTRSNANNAFIGQFKISHARINDIRRDALARQAAAPYAWHELMAVLLSAVAQAAGKRYWADKTPQNFYHFDLLSERFQQAKFIYLFRDPRAILASYKFAKGEGHNARRYHPVAYSLYWRSAIRYYERVMDHPRVMALRYEDLLSETQATCTRLNLFLNTQIRVPELASLGNNSSFSDGNRQGISDTETWVCQRICEKEMRLLHYDREPVSPTFIDVPEIFALSIRFAAFQTVRSVSDTDARHRILTFLRGLSR